MFFFPNQDSTDYLVEVAENTYTCSEPFAPPASRSEEENDHLTVISDLKAAQTADETEMMIDSGDFEDKDDSVPGPEDFEVDVRSITGGGTPHRIILRQPIGPKPAQHRSADFYQS